MKKVLLIVLIVILVLIIAGGIFICSQKDKLASFALGKTMDMVEGQLVTSLPDSVSSDSVRVVLDRVKTKLQDNELSEAQLQTFGNQLQAAFSDQKIDSLEARQLYDQLKKMSR
ncbi:hypothetical protein GF406_20190 [candidate division KSB1 bacterium]|jgi:preprotein translocase subunit SecF|nr:hypothetical protein [candidate division KSB1 bacterium]